MNNLEAYQKEKKLKQKYLNLLEEQEVEREMSLQSRKLKLKPQT